MKIEYSCITDKGSVRPANEDSILCDERIINFQDHFESEQITEKDSGENIICLAVADGMGGHKSGEVASRIALEKFSEQIRILPHSSVGNPEELKKIIRAIHEEINELAGTGSRKGMGTTLCGILFSNEKITIFNVGDSRVYTFRKGFLAQETRDHSLSEQLGRNVPKNYITSAIGAGIENIEIDIYDFTGRLTGDDIIIICSDGLTDIDMETCYDDLEKLISSCSGDLQKINSHLLSFALANDSADNISIIAAKVS